MSRVPLSDEKTRIILSGESGSNLDSLDGEKQRDVLKKLLDISESDAPPDSFVYEKIQNLDIIKYGGQGRLYTKVVANIPRGDTEYHLVYVFFIDDKHDYDRSNLVTYGSEAQERVDEITSLDKVDDVESYLDEYDALGPDDFRDLFG
jgi:hypothetical protein